MPTRALLVKGAFLLAIWAVVFPLVVLVGGTLQALLPDVPAIGRSALLSGVLVPTMVFFVVPNVRRLFQIDAASRREDAP